MVKKTYLSSLTRIVHKGKKRLGRGHGSGKVKTSGRGTKGQLARGRMPQSFEGGQLPLIKRLPLLRGKGKNRSQHSKAFPIALSKLNILPAGTVVTLETLRKYHMIESGITKVKILGKDTVKTKLTVMVSCSDGARQQIERAGGSVQSASHA